MLRLYLFAFMPDVRHKRWSLSRINTRPDEMEIGSRGDGWRIIKWFLFEFKP